MPVDSFFSHVQTPFSLRDTYSTNNNNINVIKVNLTSIKLWRTMYLENQDQDRCLETQPKQRPQPAEKTLLTHQASSGVFIFSSSTDTHTQKKKTPDTTQSKVNPVNPVWRSIWSIARYPTNKRVQVQPQFNSG